MQKVTDDVYTFDGLLVGRVYLLTAGDGLTIIDASIPSAGDKILEQLDAAGHPANTVKRILITHAHPDHVGAAGELVRVTGAQLIVPEGERAVIDGEMPVPRAGGWLKPPNTIFNDMKADQTLADGDILPNVLGGLQAVATPGHSPGHMSFWHPARKILFCGDTIFNAPIMKLPFAMLTVDMAENIRSLKKLAALEPDVVCFGHGKPLVKNAASVLAKFVAKL